MTDDIFEQISQGGGVEETAENRRIHEIADELRRRCQLHEAQSRSGEENVIVKKQPQMTANRTHITFIQGLHTRPTANYSLLTANWTFTFSAKERDPETGLSYFGSRYYSSDLSIWLSVDPMSDKYASLSPYVYCADNPVKLVDPNGEDYVVLIDDQSKTITIKATYYVTKDTREGMEMGFQYFTSQEQNLSYTMDNGESYSIKFDLSIADEFDTWEDAYHAASISGNDFSNVCRIDKTQKENALGQTEAGRVITIRPDCSLSYSVYAHEIGHTLGFSEWSFELMQSDGGQWDMGLYNEYIQQSMARTKIPTKATPTIITSPNGHVEKTTWENVGRGFIIKP